MNKAERTIAALRECAAALDDMPIRRMNMLFGTPMINTQALRDEADWLERQRLAWEEMNA